MHKITKSIKLNTQGEKLKTQEKLKVSATPVKRVCQKLVGKKPDLATNKYLENSSGLFFNHFFLLPASGFPRFLSLGKKTLSLGRKPLSLE